jgi:hypothetical protein
MHSFATCGSVLSVSDHDSIRASRELLLRSVGYSVVSLPSYSVFKEEFSNDFEIAVIGQTVDDLTASRIAVSLYRTQTNVRVLRLTAQYSRAGFSFDGSFFVEDGPGAFLRCVAELIAKERQERMRLFPVLRFA